MSRISGGMIPAPPRTDWPENGPSLHFASHRRSLVASSTVRYKVFAATRATRPDASEPAGSRLESLRPLRLPFGRAGAWLGGLVGWFTGGCFFHGQNTNLRLINCYFRVVGWAYVLPAGRRSGLPSGKSKLPETTATSPTSKWKNKSLASSSRDSTLATRNSNGFVSK